MLTLIEVPEGESPFFYAALEEWLVRHCDCAESDYLILYVNNSCAVVGKNQSIYKELNFNFWWHEAEKVVRRVSGGGTVFHDAGNLNFAFISKFEEKKVNNYRYFNEPIRQYLIANGIPATFNARNDLIANGKKISGNAQFTDRKNIISHGTLLVHADLQKISAALKENTYTVTTKAVSSVRSSVANIAMFNPKLNSVMQVKKELAATLTQQQQLLQPQAIEAVKILQREKYEDYSWRFGRSPQTQLSNQYFSITISEGKVSHVQYHDPAFLFIEKIANQTFTKYALALTLHPEEIARLTHCMQ